MRQKSIVEEKLFDSLDKIKLAWYKIRILSLVLTF